MKWNLPLCLLAMLAPLAGATQKLTVASDVWPGYVNRDTSGCYADILNEALGRNGVEVVWKLMEYDHAKQRFARGEVDSLLGAYRDEIKANALYPVWHIDCEVTQVLFLKEAFTWVDERTMAAKRVAWEKGFDMDVMLTVPVSRLEVASVAAGLAAVRAGKADFFVDERSQIRDALRADARLDMTPFTVVTFHKKKIYLVFAPGQKATTDLWDRELLKMVRDGRLKTILVKWKLMRADETISSYFMAGAS